MLKQITLFGLAFTLTMLLAELFISTSHLASVLPNEFYNDIGRGRRRNLKYVYFNEGFGVGIFNEYRYLGEANPPKKPENTIRIVLMGDSYVESFQIFERDYFGTIAENYLQKKCPGKRFEFLNFGRSGFNIADTYTYQKTFAENFNPDYIFYLLSVSDIEPKYSDPLRPKSIIKNDSLIVTFDYDQKSLGTFEKTKFLTQHFTVLNMVNNGRKKMNEIPLSAIIFDKIYRWINPAVTSALLSDENKEGKENYQIKPLTAKIIESLDPTRVIIINRDSEKLPDEFIDLCQENGLRYFDLSKSINNMKTNGINPNEWKVSNKTGHWNHQAHQVIGQELASFLCEVITSETMIPPEEN